MFAVVAADGRAVKETSRTAWIGCSFLSRQCLVALGSGALMVRQLVDSSRKAEAASESASCCRAHHSSRRYPAAA